MNGKAFAKNGLKSLEAKINLIALNYYLSAVAVYSVIPYHVQV